MLKFGLKVCLLSLLFISPSCGTSPELVDGRPLSWSQKVQCADFYNLYEVDKNLFRSEQPTNSGMIGLEKMGIKTVLNLRNILDDKQEAKGTDLKLVHHRINTWTISYDEVVKALKYIKESPKPVLVHCKHGSDRTGCIVASYRMAFMNWTKEEAIREFKMGGYGYHDNAFPNILKLLSKIDIEKLKEELK